MGSTVRVGFYDQHQWYGPRSFCLTANNTQFDVEVLEISDRPIDRDFYIFCDELIWTKFPLFVPKARRVGLMKESPIHFEGLLASRASTVFNTILTHDAKYISYGKPFRRLEYSSNWVARDPAWPLSTEKTQMTSFMGNVTRNTNSGYRFRKEVCDFLVEQATVSSFGLGINPVEYKTEALIPFRYSVVMENVKQDYYFSEKIIDCFLTKTLPIYWGCPSIGEIFEAGGIIHFDTLDELRDIIASISVEDYENRLESITSNYEICLTKRLDSFDSYLVRIFEDLEGQKLGSGSKFSLGHSKAAAAVRLIARL